jgi:hypothetical protein
MITKNQVEGKQMQELITKKVASLSEKHQAEVMSALDSREWITRRQIARRIGKDRIGPGELAALNALIALGKVEMAEQPDSRPMGRIFVYRLAS